MMLDTENERGPGVDAPEPQNSMPQTRPKHPSAVACLREGVGVPSAREVVAWAVASYYSALRDQGDFAASFLGRFAAFRLAGIAALQKADLPPVKIPSKNTLLPGVLDGA